MQRRTKTAQRLGVVAAVVCNACTYCMAGPEPYPTAQLLTQDLASDFANWIPDPSANLFDPSLPNTGRAWSNYGPPSIDAPCLALWIEGLRLWSPSDTGSPAPAGYRSYNNDFGTSWTWPQDNAEREAITEALGSGMALYRLSDGARVAAQVRAGGYFGIDGEERPAPREARPNAISLVPDAVPQGSGWYLFVVDLRPAEQLGLYLDAERGEGADSVLFARVYLGSRPMWTHAELPLPGTGSGQFGLFFSEPVDRSVLEEASIRVTYDGVEQACTTLALYPRSAWVNCRAGAPRDGTAVQVTLESQALVDPHGTSPASLQTIADSRTQWVEVAPELGLSLLPR